ncbi:hypothetical protein CQW23_18447 [Capsicum baccatum]|uniref:NB-ARC domain-containing protein n=1 Tax=Capsicum baccatum TaxID=33114 RepID=A0A2G2W315_CAPBA|nr:hypothetical protein CQW23_18447 [Capsicum baccatum]
MAYAALSSLMHTLQKLLHSKSSLICGTSILQQHVESVYQSLCALQVFLEDTTNEVNDTENLKVLEKKIRDVVYKAEERIDSSFRRIITLADRYKRERACKSFNDELQKVEKELESLKIEVLRHSLGVQLLSRHSRICRLDLTVGLGSSLDTSRKYSTEQNTFVGMKDEFNTILDRLTDQPNDQTVISLVGMGGIGKTTLAREVYDNPSIRCRFDKLAWVTISECQSILSLSYRYLPQHLKACFLYVGGFPEDIEIIVSKLIRLWIAELFVKGRSNKRLEVVAEEYLDELIDRSLTLAGTRKPDGRMKTCKIHDLLRQLCIREGQFENFMHVLNDNDYSFSEGIHIYPRRVMLLSLGTHWKHLYVPRHWSGITTKTIHSLIFTGNSFQVYRTPQFVSHFKLLKADSWQSGPILFGRFKNEALCWEMRSSFTHNRYLKEIDKYIKPDSVTEKKAYFEELFKKRALLSQSSSDCQDGADSQASNDGSENTDYEEDFKHVNEIVHSTCFVENYDRAATLLENEKYRASENKGYVGRFDHVNEVGHSACFDENYDSSTHLSKNGKYQAENTGYDGDSDFDVLQSVPECLEAEAKFNVCAGNSAFNDPKVSSDSKANLLNQNESTEEQPIVRKVVAYRASYTEKFFMKIEEKVHAKEEETCQPQARTQEKKEAEIKQVWRNLNFKATLMPAFYREPNHRSDKTKISEVIIHPSAELSDSSVPSAATRKMSKQTQSNRTISPKREQEKRQVTNSPRPRTSDSIRRNKDFKAEDKTKVLARRIENHATRKDVRSVDLSHSTRVGRLAVGVAS